MATRLDNPISWQCPVCRRGPVRVRLFPIHCACGFTQPLPTLGLGDRVAVMLSRLGLTERRYRQIKGRLGLRPDCRCNKRREALNRLTQTRRPQN